MVILNLALAILLLASSTVGAVLDDQTTPAESVFRSSLQARGQYARLELRYLGVYKLTGAELAAAGVPLDKLTPGKLAIWCGGKQLPINVVTTAADKFGAADTIEFMGEPPRGTYSYYMPSNLYNVYFLRWDEEKPLRYQAEKVKNPNHEPSPLTFIHHAHHEQDLYYVHSALPPGITDNFFWFHFRAGQQGKYPLRVDFPGISKAPGTRIDMRIKVFGMSEAGPSPQHKFDVVYGSLNLGGFQFDGKKYHDYQTSMPATAIKQQEIVSLSTPAGRESAVDWVMVDSIDVDYPRYLDASGEHLFTFTNRLEDKRKFAFFDVHGVIAGTRVFCPSDGKIYIQDSPGSARITVRNNTSLTTFTAVRPNGCYRVDTVEFVPASTDPLAMPADTQLLLVYHHSLQKAAMFLADYRRASGMRVHTADVGRIFDLLNQGYIDDAAMKKYFRFAQSKAGNLQYLLLMGDSTTDYRESSMHDEYPVPRVLIPIHWVVNPATTWTGGYPDDNWYGAFGKSNYPDISVGRIPVSNNDDGFAYIRKTLEYEQLGRSKKDPALLVSSVEESFQDLVRETETTIRDQFSTVSVLFPASQTADQEVRKIQEQLTSGVQLMYYVGHGGSMVWRVGPVDFAKQKDLFTPKEVQKLTNRLHYPIIICSSCYTTSFDNSVSIGEAFLSKPEGGAIAIVGTPWKSTVYEDHAFNKYFIDAYLDKKVTTLGQAFLEAKNKMRPAGQETVDMQSFTLLGDPCLKLERYR